MRRKRDWKSFKLPPPRLAGGKPKPKKSEKMKIDSDTIRSYISLAQGGNLPPTPALVWGIPNGYWEFISYSPTFKRWETRRELFDLPLPRWGRPDCSRVNRFNGRTFAYVAGIDGAFQTPFGAFASFHAGHFVSVAHGNGKRISPRLLRWLSARYDSPYIVSEDTVLIPENEGIYCPLSDAIYSPEAEFVTYYVRNSYGRFIEETAELEAVEDHCFQCETSGHWFARDEFTCVDVDGDSVCFEYHEDSLYYWECDGEYHWDMEEEDDEGAGEVDSYHSCANRHTRHAWSLCKGAGIELELYSKHRANVASIARSHGLLAEEDGSLHASYGVELIGAPFSLEDYQSAKSPCPWSKVLAELCAMDETKGYGAGEGYSIHVSLTRSLFGGDLNVAKYAAFINRYAIISECVAQRANAYNGGFDRNTKVIPPSRRERKYSAVNVEDGRVETRIFRSNLRNERLVKAVEYCFAGMEYVKNASMRQIEANDGQVDFLEWLASGGNAKRFPNLVSYLIQSRAKLTRDFQSYYALTAGGELPRVENAFNRLERRTIPAFVECI